MKDQTNPRHVPFKRWKINDKAGKPVCVNGSTCTEPKIFNWIKYEYLKNWDNSSSEERVMLMNKALRGFGCIWLRGTKPDGSPDPAACCCISSYKMEEQHVDYLDKNWNDVMPDVKKPSKDVLNSMAYPCPGCQMNYYDIKYGIAGGWINRDCYLPSSVDKKRFKIYGTATSGEGRLQHTKTEVMEKPENWMEGTLLPKVMFWNNAKIIDPGKATENRANFARAKKQADVDSAFAWLDPQLDQQLGIDHATRGRRRGGKRTRRRRKRRKRKSRKKRRKRR